MNYKACLLTPVPSHVEALSTEQSSGLIKCCEPASRPVSRHFVRPPDCSQRFVTLSSPAVLQSVVSLRLILSLLFALLVAFLVHVLLLSSGMRAMALRPSSVLLRVSLPPPPKSSLPEVPNPESNRARAASPTDACLLATAVTDLSFESATASALVVELLHFAAACCLDYATALVAESASAIPSSVGGECALL
ncbi:unnamed protein product [Closterium sp. NIES-53]